MDLEKFGSYIDLPTAAYSVLAFIVLFSVGFLLYPSGEYSSNIGVVADSENPEQLIEFDDRNVTLGYDEVNSEKYLVVDGRREVLDINGRENDIFAVNGKIYMFYFESGEEFIRLIRIEQL